jgi:hypothetical protein
MRKTASIILVLLLALGLTSMTAHKFYVAIFQVNYVPEKKMLQVTSRIFIDDLNHALKKKYNRPFHLGEKEETPEEEALMQKYFSEKFSVKINGKPKALAFLSKEMESTVLICYFRATDVPKITALTINNKLLFDFVTEQQNIIQTNVNGKKESLLLTPENPEGTITY